MTPSPRGSSPLPGLFQVRDARPDDLDAIVGFNKRLAEETEGKTLDLSVVMRGVRAALNDPGRLRYWVVESSAVGLVVGQAAVTREWSDWRDGWLWWLQSVYVHHDARGRGVFRSLHGHIRATAMTAGDVVGLRLYVERDNAGAMRAYESLGLRPGGYHVYEEVWPERFGGIRS